MRTFKVVSSTIPGRNIQYYADKVHAVGGNLVIDATFAPPPLQYPFKWGADMIMHSGELISVLVPSDHC